MYEVFTHTFECISSLKHISIRVDTPYYEHCGNCYFNISTLLNATLQQLLFFSGLVFFCIIDFADFFFLKANNNKPTYTIYTIQIYLYKFIY